jgi:hypothetical protein
MLSGKYQNKKPAAFFKRVYDLRSGLVHVEKPDRPRPAIDDIRKYNSELERFVLDLLDAST